MDEPLVTMVESPTPQHQFQRIRDREEEAARYACFVALFLQSILAILVVGLTLMAYSRFASANVAPYGFLVSVLITAEFGGLVFLSHGWFMLPRSSSTRFMALVGSFSIAAVQCAIFSTIGGSNTPSVFSYFAVALTVYVASLWMTGWFFHRIFGAKLSFKGEDVFQGAIGTKVLLLLSPFFVVLGMFPILGSMVLGQTSSATNSATTIVLTSLGMLASTVFPLAIVYLVVGLVGLKGYSRFIAVGVIATMIAITFILDQMTMRGNWRTLAGLLTAYVAGVGLGLAPFIMNGFWPVRAKREINLETENSVSFDDIV